MRNTIDRRYFLKLSALGAGAVLLKPSTLFAGKHKRQGDIRFAMSSDVHIRYQPKDYGCADGYVSPPEKRWSDFFKAAADWDSEVVIDLGDLQPRTFEDGPGRQAIDTWNSWHKEKIAVYGNHDNDFMPKEEYLKAMGMPSPFYIKRIKNWTFIILDTGELRPHSGAGENDGWGFGVEGEDCGKEQLPWLKKQIEEAPGYCVVLSHFCVKHGDTPLPTEPFRKLLKEANDKAGYTKIVACFYGHRHIPAADIVDGIYFIGINSINYRYIPIGGFFFYLDPAPWATGIFTEDGNILLNGAGIPNNWAVDCEKVPLDTPPDDLTYQISIPKK